MSLGTRLRTVLGVRLGTFAHHPPRPLTPPLPDMRHDPAGLPSIAIVTPSFNQGRFIGDTVRSVLGQRYPRLRLHVQDGGSTDDTAAVLAALADPALTVVSERDAGQADALNRGFARVDGEIMAYLNSDDLLLGDALWRVGAWFRDHPEVDVVYGNRIVIDEAGRATGRWILPRHDARVLRLIDYVPQETLFWRREAWTRTGARFEPALHFAMDWDFLLRLMAAGARFAHLPGLFGAFRVHAQQKTVAAHRSHGRPEMAALRRARPGLPAPGLASRWDHARFLLDHRRADRRFARETG